MLEQLTKYRRDLHQIPELAFDLFLTNEYLTKELLKMGYEVHITAKTGIIAYKKGRLKESIAYRTDMDALPVTEATNVSFKSLHEGKMHACGHDGHMAMMLGFASYMKDKELVNESLVLIFQPAEETDGGAKYIIDEGMLKKFNVTKIFGIHLYPELEEGIYGLVDGPMMARNGEFNITLKGKSSHGAQPQNGLDAIVASSYLINQYQTIISRSIKPLDTSVITVGTIHGGEARNIISQEVKLTGTMRAFKDEVYHLMKKRMTDIGEGIEKSFNLLVNTEIIDFYPVVNNDHNLYLHMEKILDKKSYELIEPMMISEDFSFYQKEVPGIFFMLGTKNEELNYIHPLHSCYFNFKEEVLVKGVELYIKIAESFNLYKK